MTPRILNGYELSAQDVYDIWRIRDQVFAFEQHVEDTDVDGRDLLDSTTHFWVSDGEGATSYLRVYVADGIRHIGRVCTRKDQRGKGLSGELMNAVKDKWGHDDLHLNAQAYLEQWYSTLGYIRSGDDYVEAGILHTPMVRPAQQR